MVLGSLGSLGRSAAYLWVCCAKIYVLLSKGFVVNDGRRFWPLTDYFFSPAAYAVYPGKFSMWRGTGFWVSLR